MIDNIWFGFGRPATGPISSNFAPSGIYTADVTKYQTPDGIEKANKLLDEAGFPRKEGGIRFEIVHDITPYGPEWQRFGEVVQQQLAKIGIKASLRYEDVATWLKRVYSDYDFALTSNFLYNLPDPVIGVHRAIHGKLIKQGTVFVNGSQWSDPQADALMDKATIEPDPQEARRLLSRGAEDCGRRLADCLGVRADLSDHRQQALSRRDHESARHLYQLRARHGGVGLALGRCYGGRCLGRCELSAHAGT